MILATWDDSFLLGVRQFDENHQRLFKLLNMINDQLTGKVPLANPAALLNAFSSLSTFYFVQEERWMAQISFPGLSEHKEEHDLLISTIADVQLSHSQTSSGNEVLLLFLNGWIHRHFNFTNERLRLFMQHDKPVV